MQRLGDDTSAARVLLTLCLLWGCQPTAPPKPQPPQLNWQERDAAILPATSDEMDAAGTDSGQRGPTAVTAQVDWSPLLYFPAGSLIAAPPSVEVALLLQGGDAGDIVATGHVQLNDFQTSNGQLRRIDDQLPIQARTELKLIDRENVFAAHPDQGVRLSLLFTHPLAASTKINTLSGSVPCVVAKRRQAFDRIPLAELPQLATSDPLLVAAGTQVTKFRAPVVGWEVLALSSGPQSLLGNVHVVDSAGNELTAIGVTSTIFAHERSGCEISNGETTLPTDCYISFVLNSELQYLDVPFDLTNLSIPPPDVVATPEQRLSLTWIPSEISVEAPVGLHVNAQCRWGYQALSDSAVERAATPLEVVLELTGPALKNIVGMGSFEVTEVITSQGPLARNHAQFSDDLGIRLIGIEEVVGATLDTLPAVFSFDGPPTKPSQIERFSGQLTVITAESSQFIRLTDPFSTDASHLQHEALRARNINLKLERFDGQFVLVAVGATPDLVGKVRVTAATGETLKNVSCFRTSLPGVTEYSIAIEGALPAKPNLELELLEHPQRHVVPFRFQNLPVPSAPGEQ